MKKQAAAAQLRPPRGALHCLSAFTIDIVQIASHVARLPISTSFAHSMAQSQLSCPYGGGPPTNTDVSGVGVRFSFYLQTLFLSLLCARSSEISEIMNALYTLMFTNMAMAVTALILGFEAQPEISFPDGLVISYLLSLSTLAIVVSFPACARHSLNDKKLTVFFILHCLAVFGWGFSLLISAPTFGNAPLCNSNAVVAIFHPFRALPAGRVIGLLGVCLALIFVVLLLLKDHMAWAGTVVPVWILRRVTIQISDGSGQSVDAIDDPDSVSVRPGSRGPASYPSRQEYQSQRDGRATVQQGYDLQIMWPMILNMSVTLVLWIPAVVNTELLIRWNNLTSAAGSSSWQFGQVLPMFLVVLPLIDLINSFRKHGIKTSHRALEVSAP
ncbi:unnamed protein product [Mycena citricolor]|uniref:Uncharacterized protein n=1 Tax=Mycena citricolor TaxID=2018698 RepID=A0AAD2K0Q4_9AGAR|nr:unnamed protein product [Mycena citricolor]